MSAGLVRSAAGDARAQLKARTPAAEQVGRPALRWGLVALAVAGGGALGQSLRVALVAAAVGGAVVAAAALRSDPVPGWARPHVALLVAVALLAGGSRAAALEPAVVTPGPVSGVVVELLEPLRAADGGGARARVTPAGGEPFVVQLAAGRYAERVPESLPAGARLIADGELTALAPRTNDRSQQDLSTQRAVIAHLRRSGVSARLRVDRVDWSGQRRSGVIGALDRAGERAEHELAQVLGDRRGALVAGMALGRAGGIGDTDAEALRDAGLWHLVAASGGNIALVVALVMGLGWAAGVPDRGRLMLAASAVAAYVPLAGAGPSIQRAGVMGLVALVALWRGQEHRALEALAIAAAATLLLQPAAWQDVGWQLSFAAALALIVAAPRVVARLISVGVPRWPAVAVACSLVATLATAPITLYTFGELSAIGLVANLLVTPLVGVVVWCGVLALCVGLVATAPASLIAAPAGWAATAILSVAEWGAGREHAVIGPRSALACVFALALLVALRLPPRWIGRIAVGAVVAVAALAPRAPNEPRLVVLDVGQGSAALLQHGRDGVLFDTGPRGAGVVQALRRTGVRRLRAVVLSHPAADHDGGTAEVLAAFPTDLLLDGGTPGGGAGHAAGLAAARREQVPVALVRAGQRISVGAIDVRVLWPTPAAVARAEDPNDRSAVLMAQIGSLRALLPGDAEGNVLRGLRDLDADLLVLGHHGSRDEHLPAALRRIRPAAGVISVGAGNSYGHPAPETLAALSAAGVPALRTDLLGGVAFTESPEGKIDVQRSAGGER